MKGWSKRRRQARRRQMHGRTPEEWEQIKAARRAHREGRGAPTQAPQTAQQTETQSDKSVPVPTAWPAEHDSRPVFNLGGNWMQRRAEVRDALQLDKVPGSKAEARAYLSRAGFQVRE